MAGIKIKKSKNRKSWADFFNQDIQFSTSFNNSNKEYFYKQLGILLVAGIDIKSVLDLLIDQQKGKSKEITLCVKHELIQGSSFSDALKNQKVFTPYEYYSVQIGEETGNLPAVMNDLALYYHRRVKQKRQLISTLMYPAMVIMTSFVAIFFMINFIVPMFADIFHRSGNDLPFITQSIIAFSSTFKQYLPISCLCLIALASWLYSQRKREWFRRLSSKLLMKLPVFGSLIRKIFMARFCNSMTLLTASKISLVRAIELSRQMVNFYPVEISLIEIETQITNGNSLHKSLATFPIYDSQLISLVTVGEEVNQLSLFFEKIAQQYNEDIEHQSALLSSVLEPFIIIILGFFVGFILVAMYLPLFQLGTSFG